EEGIRPGVGDGDLQPEFVAKRFQDLARLRAERAILLDQQLDLHPFHRLVHVGILRQSREETKMRTCWRCRAASPSSPAPSSFASRRYLVDRATKARGEEDADMLVLRVVVACR